MLMGVGKLDNANGHKPADHDSEELRLLLLTLREGDVIVHPAGTGHANISDEGDYRYLSFFPSVSMSFSFFFLQICTHYPIEYLLTGSLVRVHRAGCHAMETPSWIAIIHWQRRWQCPCPKIQSSAIMGI